MITLKLLKWNNCFSYGENNSLDLSESNLTQIIGDNGAGKSSIPLIIEEVLYNKNSKGIKKADIPNRHTDGGYDIELHFSKNDNDYVIEVARKAGIKVKLYENGEDISSHTATATYKTLQEVLGMDFKTFSQLVYQNPKSSLQFLTATDTNRKKFLIDLLNLQEYVTLFEHFKELAKEKTSKKTAIDSKLNTIESWLEKNKLEDTTPKPLLNLTIEKDVDEEEIRSLAVQISNATDTNRKIAQNNQNQKLLDKIDIREFQGVEKETLIDYDDLQKELGSWESTLSNAEASVKELEKLESVCSKCGQSIDRQEAENQLVVERELVQAASIRVDDLTDQINNIKETNTNITKKRQLQKRWEDLYRSVDSTLDSEPLNVDEMKVRHTDLKEKLEGYQAEVERRAEENNKRSEYNTRIKVLVEQAKEMQTESAELSKELDELSAICADLEVLKKSFSTNGLVAYKIENLVKELETLVNEYLSELSDGQFNLEFVVVQDKLNVIITDDSLEVNILSLSTGELGKVNTATLLAIRKLMNSISSSKINVLFLDEVISVLDEQGKERLVEVLLKEQELNTYAVSHGYSHPLVQKIEVVKEDGFSCLT